MISFANACVKQEAMNADREPFSGILSSSVRFFPRQMFPKRASLYTIIVLIFNLNNAISMHSVMLLRFSMSFVVFPNALCLCLYMWSHTKHPFHNE